MANFTNSKLIDYTSLSPNYDKRQKKITKITPHHMAGRLSVESCGRLFNGNFRSASSNYGIGFDGRKALYVEEKNRAWSTSNWSNDQRAVNVELSNSAIGDDWPISDVVLDSFVELAADICSRNGIPKLIYTGEKESNFTQHNFFVPTACPGPFLESRMPQLAKVINAKINKKPIDVKPKPTGLHKVQVGAFKNKDNAERLKEKLEAIGYSVWIVRMSGLYKVQVGAFSSEENAISFKKRIQTEYKNAYDEELEVYITKEKPIYLQPKKAPAIKRGDKIKIRKGAKDLNYGSSFANWVFEKEHTVLVVGDDYVSFGVIKKINGKEKDVFTGKVKKSDVIKI